MVIQTATMFPHPHQQLQLISYMIFCVADFRPSRPSIVERKMMTGLPPEEMPPPESIPTLVSQNEEWLDAWYYTYERSAGPNYRTTIREMCENQVLHLFRSEDVLSGDINDIWKEHKKTMKFLAMPLIDTLLEKIRVCVGRSPEFLQSQIDWYNFVISYPDMEGKTKEYIYWIAELDLFEFVKLSDLSEYLDVFEDRLKKIIYGEFNPVFQSNV